MNACDTSTYGILITLEGDDGVGKSTQADLLAAWVEEQGLEVLRVHEPGGTKLGEEIRSILLSKEQEGMAPLAELLLYEAARAQVMQEVIKPALAAGKVVICDRFCDSTLAYQGYGRELGADLVRSLNELACDNCQPARTLLLVLNPAVAQERVVARAEDGEGDRMESAGGGFHERLRDGFAQIAQQEPERVHVIEAEGGVEDVHEAIRTDLASLIAALKQPACDAEADERS